MIKGGKRNVDQVFPVTSPWPQLMSCVHAARTLSLAVSLKRGGFAKPALKFDERGAILT